MGLARAVLGIAVSLVLVAACTTPAPSGPAMSVTDAHAYQLPGSLHPIIVVATITNATGHEDALVGGSSPVAKRVELSATTGLALPSPTDVGTGMNDMPRMELWRIEPGETITLKGGGGHLTLVGPDHPVQSGQTVEVTFRFRASPPVVVQVPVE